MDVPASDTTATTIEALQALLAATQAKLIEAEDRLATTQSELKAERAGRSGDQTLIAHLKLTIAKMQRDRFGPKSERSARFLDQMELQLEELEANVIEERSRRRRGCGAIRGRRSIER